MNEFLTTEVGIAGISGFVIALLTWLGTYLNDKHKRDKDLKEFEEASHKTLITEYTDFNERVQKREETLLKRIDELETKLKELQTELIGLNKVLLQCLQSGKIHNVEG
jgi:uncharacterized protein YlxW (UPF0749 family)